MQLKRCSVIAYFLILQYDVANSIIYFVLDIWYFK